MKRQTPTPLPFLSLALILAATITGDVFGQTATMDATWIPDFSQAEKWADQSRQDIVVVIGADWCAPCHVLKRNMVEYAKSSKTESVQLAYLDFDSNESLAKTFMQGTVVPQVIYLQRIEGDWKPVAVLPRLATAEEIANMIQWTQKELRRSTTSPYVATNSTTPGQNGIERPRPMLPPDPTTGYGVE